MLLTPAPDAAETRANRAFDATLWALSRPGLTQQLPDPGPSCLIDALLDRECRAHVADARLMAVAAATGAHLVELPDADHVFLNDISELTLLEGLKLGSDEYPDDGATVIAQAEFGTGRSLRLTGPGIKGTETVQIGALPDGFWAWRKALIRYPMGFDLLLLQGDLILGLPRSTKIEVL